MITHEAILSKLAELRTIAEAATNHTGRWRWDHGIGDMCNDPECPYGALLDETGPGASLAGTVLMEVHGYDIREPWQGAAHIATWDPAHSLRWIEWAEDVAREHGELGHAPCDAHDGATLETEHCDVYTGLARALGLPDQHDGRAT